MKQGTIKTIKETSILLEMGIDFQANDLEDTFNGLRSINQKKLNEILNKFNEYKTSVQFTHKEWDKISDKDICEIMEAEQNKTKLKLAFNEFGAYLRTYQDNELEGQYLRIKYNFTTNKQDIIIIWRDT